MKQYIQDELLNIHYSFCVYSSVLDLKERLNQLKDKKIGLEEKMPVERKFKPLEVNRNAEGEFVTVSENDVRYYVSILYCGLKMSKFIC